MINNSRLQHTSFYTRGYGRICSLTHHNPYSPFRPGHAEHSSEVPRQVCPGDEFLPMESESAFQAWLLRTCAPPCSFPSPRLDLLKDKALGKGGAVFSKESLIEVQLVIFLGINNSQLSLSVVQARHKIEQTLILLSLISEKQHNVEAEATLHNNFSFKVRELYCVWFGRCGSAK